MSKIPTRKVLIEGHDGLKLSGVLHEPQVVQKPGVILAHCFTCSKDYKILVWLGSELAAKGYPVLRFDFAGLGDSQGEFAATTLSTNIEDLSAAYKWMNSQGWKVEALVGHSLGGTAVILAAGHLPGVRTVAVMGTSSRVGTVTRVLKEGDWETLRSRGEVTVSVGAVMRPIRLEFVKDLEKYSVQETVGQWNKALLVVHGTNDRLVSSKIQEELFLAARQPKAFFSMPGADHLFANSRKFVPQLASVLDAWIELNGESR